MGKYIKDLIDPTITHLEDIQSGKLSGISLGYDKLDKDLRGGVKKNK